MLLNKKLKECHQYLSRLGHKTIWLVIGRPRFNSSVESHQRLKNIQLGVHHKTDSGKKSTILLVAALRKALYKISSVLQVGKIVDPSSLSIVVPQCD